MCWCVVSGKALTSIGAHNTNIVRFVPPQDSPRHANWLLLMWSYSVRGRVKCISNAESGVVHRFALDSPKIPTSETISALYQTECIDVSMSRNIRSVIPNVSLSLQGLSSPASVHCGEVTMSKMWMSTIPTMSCSFSLRQRRLLWTWCPSRTI